jgi:hypothetical protein
MLKLRSRYNPIAVLMAAVLPFSFLVPPRCMGDPTAAIVMAPVAVPPGKILVAEATPIKLLLDQDLKSGSCHVGDAIEYDLESDLYTTDRQLIAPAGAKAYGKVLQSSGHGMFGKPGKLRISADYLLDPDRTKIPLRGNQIGGGGKGEVAGMVALTLLVTVFGVFVNGRDVNLHKGQEIPMYVDQDTFVTPYMTIVANAGQGGAPTRTLYIMNDGTQVVGVQNAFDGTTYSVTTDSGMRLIKATDVKDTYQVTGTSSAATALPAASSTTATAATASAAIAHPAKPAASK